MSEPALLLILLTFAVIGVLVRVFFRKTGGRFGARWWLMALPFFLDPAVLVAAYALPIAAMTPAAWGRWQALAAVTLGAASVALIFLTLGSHRVRIAAFHQDNDAPQYIVTHGAYRWIRHPFYAAFILLFLAAFVLFPHWLTLALLAYVAGGLTVTAAREERRLSVSQFGDEYRRYLACTGRFIPRLRNPRTRPAPPQPQSRVT